MVREPEPPVRDQLVDSLKEVAPVSFGPAIDPLTTVLVEGQLKPEHMEAAPKVEHVIIPFAGLQPKTKEVLLKYPGVKVYNLHHNASATAEMAMALLLACARRIVGLHNGFCHDDWEPRYFSRDALGLFGKNVVVLGFGEIGQRVGRMCEGFGMKVVGVTSQNVGDLRSLLPTADYLVVTAPLTPATEGLVGAEEIGLLPSNAVVVNVGRGKVIDEGALFAALKEERIDSAGLDVWWQYPRSPEEKVSPSAHPFGSLRNVVMTPHVGGGWREAEPARMAALADLLRQIASGGSPRTLDIERGY